MMETFSFLFFHGEEEIKTTFRPVLHQSPGSIRIKYGNTTLVTNELLLNTFTTNRKWKTLGFDGKYFVLFSTLMFGPVQSYEN